MNARPVLFLHPSAELYGADQALLALVGGLDRSRWRPVVALPCPGPLVERLRAAGVEVEVGPLGIGARASLSPRGLVFLARDVARGIAFARALVRRHRPALVHVNTLVVLGGAVGARSAGARLVWHVHEILERPRWLARAFAHTLPRLAARLVFVSHASAHAIARYSRRAAARTTVVHNGLAPEHATDARHAHAARAAVRSELGVDPDGVLVLLPGRINAWKGQALLVEAARALHAAHPRAHFVFAGGAPHGQGHFEAQLDAAIERAGTYFRRVPFRADPGELYRAADIVVVPSTRPEPFGLVAIEAMAFARPVVAAGHGGLIEIVEHERTGLVFEPSNPAALADALARLIVDADLRDELGRRGRDRAHGRFGLEAHVAGVERAYREVLGVPATHGPTRGPARVHIALGKANPARMNGVNQVVHHVAEAQARAGRRVEVWGITPNPHRATPERAYALRLVPRTHGRFRVARSLTEALRAAPRDCVFHLHGGFLPEMHAVARELARGRRPFVFTPHGAYAPGALRKSRWMKQLYARLFERRLVRAARRVHALTPGEVRDVEQQFATRNTCCVPNGCRVDPLPPPAIAPQGPLTVGFLGRLSEHTKGLDLLLEGVARRVRAGARVELLIAGDGPDREQLVKRAERLRIEAHVRFLGPLFGDDKRAFLADVAAIVLCSRHEGMPIAILEALGAGRPVLVTPGTGFAETVRAAGAGLVAVPTATGVADALEALERTAARGGLEGLAEAALALARASSWDRIAERLEGELYGLGSQTGPVETNKGEAPLPAARHPLPYPGTAHPGPPQPGPPLPCTPDPSPTSRPERAS
ncbi:MAG: glycosyltransferase [bacterium]|nr:glycosyltransferase [bacterium]